MGKTTLVEKVPSKNSDGSTPAYQALLARVKKALETTQEITVPAEQIRPYLTQPREFFNPEGIRRLSASIDAGGQTSSGMVREKPAPLRYQVVDTGKEIELKKVAGSTKYELIDGERRWRGIGLISEFRRPLYRAKLIIADDDVIQYLISGITNFNREGHTAIETMKTIERHIQFGFPISEIATLLGISEHWARQIHGLKNLSANVLELLDPKLPKNEQLSIVGAVHISKMPPRLQLGLAKRVIDKHISLGQLRGEVVRIAAAAGSPVRTREVEARKLWQSFGNKIDVILRTADDADSLIGKDEVSRFVRASPAIATELLRDLEKATELIKEIESKIRQARQ